MSNVNDIISFQSTGLDTDSDLLALPKGSSRYRLNIIGSEDGNHDVLTNIKGNTLKNDVTLTLPDTSGELTVVNSVEDKENNALIYFIHNSSGYPAIIRYNYGSDNFTNIINPTDGLDYYTNTSVLMASGALADGYFIDARIIGNEDDQTLVWVDGVGSPKSINISKAIANGYNAILVEDEITFYKRPFIGNIITTYDYDVAYDGNDVRGKYFQFAIRLKYFDKTFTTFSPVAEIAVPDTDNISNGRLTDEISNNYIYITFTLDHESTVIDSYQVLYREVDIGDGVPGNWNIYKDTVYGGPMAYSTGFYNNSSIGIVSDDEANRPYDFVPDISTHVGVIDSNRAVFDVTQEGFDNVSIDPSELPVAQVLTADILEVDATDEETLYSFFDLAGPSDGTAVFTHTEVATIDSDWILSIDQGANNYSQTVSSFNLTQDEVFPILEDFVDNLGLTGVSAAYSSNTLTITSTSLTIIATLIVVGNSDTYKSYKTKASYKLGLRYGYNGKFGPVQTYDGLSFETPSNADIASPSITSTNYVIRPKVTIKHQAPIGATDYQIVSFGSNIDYYEEYYVRYNGTDFTDASIGFTMYLDESDTVIKRDEMVNRFKAAYSSGEEDIEGETVDYGINYGFDFKIGDEVRFIAGWKTPYSESDINDPPFLFTQDYTYAIKSVSSTEIRLSSSAIVTVNDNFPTSPTEREHLVIQIVRKKDTFDSIAQEFSPVYGITSRNHLGIGADTDQIYSGTDAVLDIGIYFSDTYKTKQVYVNVKNQPDYILNGYFHLSSWMEKPRISLYSDSTPTINGRFNAVNEFSEARGDRKIRFTGKFLDEAGVNFLSKVEFDDERFVDDRNGIITKIEQIGDTLKVNQKRKISGFRLKAITSTDIDGDNISAYSSAVMSPSPYQTDLDFGCTNFESYVKNVRSAYFFDVKNGAVVRDSPAGLEPVSDYGMHTFFKDISQQILTLGEDKVRVLGVYDDDNDMYVISFVYKTDLSNAVNKSLAFHEATNKWVSFYSLPTSSDLNYYGRLSGKTFTSFLNGNLYLHNDNSTRCNLWGQQYGSQVRVHSNENPNLIKVWNNVEIVSTGQWSPSSDGDVTVNLPTEQQSRLKAGKFELQEGEYRSDFMRDMLSGGSSVVENNLFNGEALRGYDVHVNLRNADTSEANLRLVKINGTVST